MFPAHSAPPAPLVETLVKLLGSFRPAFSQDRVFERACSLVMGSVFTFSRKTMTQILTSLGEVDQDWTAAYRLLSRERFSPERVSSITFGATLDHLPDAQPYTAVIDVTHVPRSSLKMPGTSWTRAPKTAAWARGFARAQRFENICWLTPIEEGYSRAVPLQWIHAPSIKAVPTQDPPCREWEAGLQGICWMRNQLDTVGQSHRQLLVFADGAYDLNAMWKGLPANTTLVVRSAKNRRLFHFPSPSAPHTRGAHRKYGEQAPSPDLMRRERTVWTKLDIRVRGKIIHIKCRVAGPYLVQGAPEHPVFLILVKGYHRRGAKRGKRRGRRDPCQYLVNAIPTGERQPHAGLPAEQGWCLPLPLYDLVVGTWHRWEVEVCHREIKASFGLGQMQCWSKVGSIANIQFIAWAYSMLVLAGYKACAGLRGRLGTPNRWWRGAKRWSLSDLLQGFRKQLWDISQLKPVYPRIPNKGTIIQKSRISLYNAAAGTIRG